MITSTINIETDHTIESVTKYDSNTTLLLVDKALIVRKGTKDGKSTVDIQCTDKDGKKYVIMATGAIISELGNVIKKKS